MFVQVVKLCSERQQMAVAIKFDRRIDRRSVTKSATAFGLENPKALRSMLSSSDAKSTITVVFVSGLITKTSAPVSPSKSLVRN